MFAVWLRPRLDGSLLNVLVQICNAFVCPYYCSDSDLSLVNLEKAVLDKFRSLNHVPVWKTERPEVIRGNSDLRIYKIYPVGLTQREALYTWSFGGDKGLKTMLKTEPCLQLEVIFV